MLEVAQAGQAGKTDLLFSMHRFRKRIFHDKMGWRVPITEEGLEVDEFDLPDTIYVLSIDNERNVVGNWRLLPTTGPTMIECLWPHFLQSISMPKDPYAWETSRFAVNRPVKRGREGSGQIDWATKEIFCGVAELCVLAGIREIYAMYDIRMLQLFERLDCVPHTVSDTHLVDDCPSQVGAFAAGQEMLEKLRRSTGIRECLVTPDKVPPILRGYPEQVVPLPPITNLMNSLTR